MKALIPVDLIKKKILLIRGHKVMLDRGTATLRNSMVLLRKCWFRRLSAT